MPINETDYDNITVADNTADDMLAYGCIFCRTGREMAIAEKISRRTDNLTAIAPQKVLYIRLEGKLQERVTLLFPGYILVRAEEHYPVTELGKETDVLRVLTSERGCWQLMGEDREFARKMFDMNGIVGLSKVYYEGDRIRATEGLLCDYEGSIIRVDRRKCKAQVKFHIGDRDIFTWLGFEEIHEDLNEH